MQQQKKMSTGRKILIGFGIFVLIGIIGSQMDDKKSSDVKVAGQTSSANSEKTESSSSDEKPSYMKIGDQIEVGNFSYVVNSCKFAKTLGGEYTSKTADGVFLVVGVTFRNNDKEEHTLDNSFFKLTDENGTEYSSSTEGSTALEMSGKETLFLKQANPHITKNGLLVFEVPEKKVYDLHLSGGFWSGKTAVVKLTDK